MIRKMFLVILLSLITISMLLKYSSAPGKDNTIRGIDSITVMVELNKIAVRDEFYRLRDSLQFYESGDDWTIVNEIGCIGLFQFKITTLYHLGYFDVTLDLFKDNPGLFPPEDQKRAFNDLVKANWKILKDYECYIGTVINGVEVTKSGMIASAHLAGPKNVKKYLLTNGRYIFVDGFRVDIKPVKKKYNARDLNRTKISDYMQLFAGFNI